MSNCVSLNLSLSAIRGMFSDYWLNKALCYDYSRNIIRNHFTDNFLKMLHFTLDLWAIQSVVLGHPNTVGYVCHPVVGPYSNEDIFECLLFEYSPKICCLCFSFGGLQIPFHTKYLCFSLQVASVRMMFFLVPFFLGGEMSVMNYFV